MFTVGIICGGPSPERGISLNSARSVLDHLKASQVDIRVFFVDPTLTFYEIPSEQLYSNTPSDFDFKLASVGTKLDESSLQPTLKACDMVFPVIHGAFGEDGQLASLLESFSIPFIGNASDTSLKAYEKDRAQQHLANHGKPTLPHFLIQKDNLNSKELVDFWTSYIPEKAILKPVRGGSSIDVYSLSDLKSLHVRAQDLLTRHKCIMLQPYYHGTELTITVLENAQGELVALPPTATRILQKEADIFSFRAKYLPSYATHNHTPAPLPRDTLLTISKSVSEIFRLFNLRDCARFDGWYDSEKGFICNDINPMSGLEESSFFFKQAASCGLSHAQVLSLLLKRACARHQISPPKFTQHTVETDSRQTIPV